MAKYPDPKKPKEPLTYPYTPDIHGPTIVGHIPAFGPPSIPVLICSNCGEKHYSGHSLANCGCYNEFYDACLG